MGVTVTVGCAMAGELIDVTSAGVLMVGAGGIVVGCGVDVFGVNVRSDDGEVVISGVLFAGFITTGGGVDDCVDGGGAC